MSLNILEDQQTEQLWGISTLQDQDAYCKYIIAFLHILSIWKKFIKHDNILYKLIQACDKAFEALVVPKCPALNILGKSHNYYGNVGTNKLYSLIKKIIL